MIDLLSRIRMILLSENDFMFRVVIVRHTDDPFIEDGAVGLINLSHPGIWFGRTYRAESMRDDEEYEELSIMEFIEHYIGHS